MRSNYLIDGRGISILTILVLTIVNSCQAQSGKKAGDKKPISTSIVGGRCDGCDLMWAGAPTLLDSKDTSAGWNEAGQKLIISGKILFPTILRSKFIIEITT